MLQNIFKGHQAGSAAVLVDHNRHMDALLAKFFQQAAQRFAFRHKHRLAQHAFQLELLRPPPVFEQVFGVQNTQHVIFVVANHREA